MTVERELVDPVELCLPHGHLNPDAVGWSRTPLHNTDRIGRGRYGWGRNKRWEYWGMMTPTHVLALTVSSLDYASVHEIYVLDRRTLVPRSISAVSPLSGSVELPGSLGAGPVRARTRTLTIEIDEIAGGTRLVSRAEGVEFDLVAARPEQHESLGVVVPWSKRLFQYTVKDVARPLSGSVRIDGETIEVPAGSAWAVLDHGRGRWPYDMRWNWGAASGDVDGHTVGVQVGGKWTEGTGSTENALYVDGRLHKISDELVWEYDETDFMTPWRIHGERADLRFVPFFERVSTMNLLVLTGDTHQCFGHYEGWMSDDTGARVRVDGVEGWAEAVHNRW